MPVDDVNPTRPVRTAVLRSVLLALVVGCLTGTAAVGVARAERVLVGEDKLRLYGDFRLRFERDWDSHRADGRLRADRDRARIRTRLRFQFAPTEHLSFGARVRTGSQESQQSPHITIKDFDNNPEGDHDLFFDRWFAQVSGEQFWAWVGRNGFPFWKQNEFFWDDDVTPAGLAGGYRLDIDWMQWTANGGVFALPDGERRFHGRLWAGQVVFSAKSNGAGFKAAVGAFAFDGKPGARRLRQGNGDRDYRVWVGNAQVQLRKARLPFTLGLDLIYNGESYAASVAHHEEKDGFVVSARLGQLKKGGDWLGAYYYAHIGKFAVNASYAQDDWVRWGSATQTDSSDLKGHEFRAAYAFSENMNLVARLYLVEAMTSVQDGKRFRLDLNYKR